MEVWKVRCKKQYKGAHNHLVIGQVIEVTDAFVRIQGISFHFKSSVSDIKDVIVGDLSVRVIPWNNIEIANVISENFDFMVATLKMNDETMTIRFADDKHAYVICKRKVGY